MPAPLSKSAPDLEAYRLMCAGRFSEALPFAEKAVTGKHQCLPAHGMLATILMQLGRRKDAESVIVRALELAAGCPDAYDGLARVSMSLGQHERANALYRQVVELAPDTARFWYNLASSERSFGRLLEAEAACDRAITLDPDHYPSYLLRSELRVQTSERNHVEELRLRLTSTAVQDRALVFLGYAVAKELDDLECFDEAFHWFTHAAETRRRHLLYDVAVDEQKLARIAAGFSRGAIGKAASPRDSARYIFIVGLPRSGTTLLERILTGLPEVRSNGESDNFARALLSAAPRNGRDVFSRAAAADPAVVAANYATLANFNSSEKMIIEKLPMNYLYLGAIHRALPQAKLLLLRRSPLDSCFAMYRTLFGEAYPFTYAFEDLSRYFAAYNGLVDHWRSTLGEHLHEVSYEELVTDPDRVGSRVARHCGLEWTDTALEVDKNRSVSLTASAAQIRRPIYSSSVGRWRHYREHLGPLIEALRKCGVNPHV